MTDLRTSLVAAGEKAAYDSAVKDILADRQVLAWILKGTTTEFSSFSIEEIIPCIDKPAVSSIAVDPGLTNSDSSKITGLPQESSIQNEGVVYYDIRFYARNPSSDGKRDIRIIVDLEAQKSSSPGYDLVTRGIFYGGRMLSEQCGRNFTGRDYDELEKVYSIWLCFGCDQKTANTISRYRIAHESVYGEFDDLSRHDLLQVVMVRIPSEKNKDRARNAPLKLHEMLYDLIIRKMNASDKVRLLKDRYGLMMNDNEGRMSAMCNLSDYFIEEGYDRGISQGISQATEAIALSMIRKKMSPKEISEICDIPLETVEKIRDGLLQEAPV